MYHTNFMVGGFMYGIFETKVREIMAAFAKKGYYPIFIVGTVMLYGIFLPGKVIHTRSKLNYPILFGKDELNPLEVKKMDRIPNLNS